MAQQIPRLEAGRSLAATETRTTQRQFAVRRYAAAVVRHALLIAVAVVFTFPIYWMVISGLKTSAEIFERPIVWWPHSLQWQNIADTLNYPGFPFLRYLWNSVFIAGTVTLGTLFACATAAYGFGRLRFPGRDLLFGIALATLMIPGIVMFIPQYILFKNLHLIGGPAPLIVPSIFGARAGISGIFIFMLRQFFMGLPWELSEAAKVDGAGELRIFWRIMLPLVRSALIVVAIFSFVWTWQDFFGPLVYLADPNQFTLTLGLFAFHGQRTVDWTLVMVAATLSTVPLVLLFTLTQRYFVQGITMTGLKG